MTDRRAFLALALCLAAREPEPPPSHGEATHCINGWPYTLRYWTDRQWAEVPLDARPGQAQRLGEGWVEVAPPADMIPTTML